MSIPVLGNSVPPKESKQFQLGQAFETVVKVSEIAKDLTLFAAGIVVAGLGYAALGAVLLPLALPLFAVGVAASPFIVAVILVRAALDKLSGKESKEKKRQEPVPQLDSQKQIREALKKLDQEDLKLQKLEKDLKELDNLQDKQEYEPLPPKELKRLQALEDQNSLEKLKMPVSKKLESIKQLRLELQDQRKHLHNQLNSAFKTAKKVGMAVGCFFGSLGVLAVAVVTMPLWGGILLARSVFERQAEDTNAEKIWQEKMAAG